MCLGTSTITRKTASRNESGICSWKRSLMEFTNTRRGFLHLRGASIRSGKRTTFSEAFA